MKDLPLDTLTALGPLDGRYAAKVAPLRTIFSEYGLIRRRVQVEIAWLRALCAEPGIPEALPLTPDEDRLLEGLELGRAPDPGRRRCLTGRHLTVIVLPVMRDVKVPSTLTLESRFVGGLPLVNAILDRLQVDRLLAAALPGGGRLSAAQAMKGTLIAK